jgi:hypothetical protein
MRTLLKSTGVLHGYVISDLYGQNWRNLKIWSFCDFSRTSEIEIPACVRNWGFNPINVRGANGAVHQSILDRVKDSTGFEIIGILVVKKPWFRQYDRRSKTAELRVQGSGIAFNGSKVLLTEEGSGMSRIVLTLQAIHPIPRLPALAYKVHNFRTWIQEFVCFIRRKLLVAWYV